MKRYYIDTVKASYSFIGTKLADSELLLNFSTTTSGLAFAKDKVIHICIEELAEK